MRKVYIHHFEVDLWRQASLLKSATNSNDKIHQNQGTGTVLAVTHTPTHPPTFTHLNVNYTFTLTFAG